MSLKHSKYKNTYLIYEFLVRQTLSEYMSNKINKLNESKSFGLIKKYFRKGVLKEELNLYQTIVDNKVFNQEMSEYIIKECLDAHSRLPKNKLQASKYALIGEIKKHYDLDKLFSTNINEYKQSASTYLLFESHNQGKILEKSKYLGLVIKESMKPKKKIEEPSVSEIIKESSDEEKAMAFRILVNSYNKKYNSVLSESQKKVVADYMYSNTNENAWFESHVSRVKKDLYRHLKTLKERKDVDYLKLSLKECLNSIKGLESKKIIKEADISKLLSFYKLNEKLDELKKHIK